MSECWFFVTETGVPSGSSPVFKTWGEACRRRDEMLQLGHRPEIHRLPLDEDFAMSVRGLGQLSGGNLQIIY